MCKGKEMEENINLENSNEEIIINDIHEPQKEKNKIVKYFEEFEETGAEYSIKLTLLKDLVTVTVDTTGKGLHKRAYRILGTEAPLKETLAAALVMLSFWKEGRMLADPLCGSGTIPIEAAMIGKNIAPGLNRNFVSEGWHIIEESTWKEERKRAFGLIKNDADIRIEASDISETAIQAAVENAKEVLSLPVGSV